MEGRYLLWRHRPPRYRVVPYSGFGLRLTRRHDLDEIELAAIEQWHVVARRLQRREQWLEKLLSWDNREG